MTNEEYMTEGEIQNDTISVFPNAEAEDYKFNCQNNDQK